MIKKVMAIFLLLCVYLPLYTGCSCYRAGSTSSFESCSTPASSETSAASVLNYQRYDEMKVVTKTDKLLYGKPAVSFSKLYSDNALRKITVDDVDYNAWIWSFTDDRTLIFCSDSEKDPVIAEYSLKDGQYTLSDSFKRGACSGI